MLKFSKELESFLNSVNIPGIKTKEDKGRYTQNIPRSASYIAPGNILVFTYNSAPTVAFVVSTPKSSVGGGKYSNHKGNTLVTAFRLDGVPDIVIQSIVSNLYMKPNKSGYINRVHKNASIGRADRIIKKSKGEAGKKKSLSVSRSLKTVLGKDKFRTYNLGKMLQIHKVEIPKDTDRSEGSE